MAFDGITTACLRKEFSDRLTGARIYKIAQTDRDELVLTLKPSAERGGGQCRLYLSADASLPLAYFTAKNRQAPLQAPSFCMLLRKHLQNGRILSVTQPGLERVLRFEVEHLASTAISSFLMIRNRSSTASNISLHWSVLSEKYFRADPILSRTPETRRTLSKRPRKASMPLCAVSRSRLPNSCSPVTRVSPHRWLKNCATERRSPMTGVLPR